MPPIRLPNIAPTPIPTTNSPIIGARLSGWYTSVQIALFIGAIIPKPSPIIARTVNKTQKLSTKNGSVPQIQIRIMPQNKIRFLIILVVSHPEPKAPIIMHRYGSVCINWIILVSICAYFTSNTPRIGEIPVILSPYVRAAANNAIAVFLSLIILLPFS